MTIGKSQMKIVAQHMPLASPKRSTEDRLEAQEEYVRARAYYALMGEEYEAGFRCFDWWNGIGEAPIGFRKISGVYMKDIRRLRLTGKVKLIPSPARLGMRFGREIRIKPGLYVRADHYVLIMYGQPLELKLR